MSNCWQKTTIGEVASIVAERIDPASLDDEIYVGLEHLVSNARRLSMWGSTSDVLSSTTPFLPGDTLFGRLRPYLRKGCVAPVTGFCSPEVLVVRPTTGIIPQFLGLLVLRDAVFQECNRLSAGSRMPRTSAKDLMGLPVLVPPLAEQRRIADLIGLIDSYIDSLQTQVEATRSARSALLSDLLSSPGDDWQDTSLGQLSDPAKPICYGVLKPGPNVDGGVPLIKIGDMDSDTIAVSGGVHRISHELDQEFARSRLNGGEVLLSIQGTVGRVAIVGDSLRGANISRTIARIDSGDFGVNLFIRLWLQHAAEVGLLYAVGTTRASLNIGEIRRTALKMPPLIEQRRIVDLVGSFDEQVASLELQIASAQVLRGGVLSELLSGERLLDESYDVAVSL